MPELPEVETIRRQLSKKILYKKIKEVEVFDPRIIQGSSVDDFKKIVSGKKVKNISRKGKLLIFELSENYYLVVHLKLTGQLILQEKEGIEKRKKYTSVIYVFSDGKKLFHNDLRKFGYVCLLNKKQLKKFLEEKKYGIEPLSKEFTLDKFKTLLLKKPKSKIKPLLMDQSFIAGIGNIYSQESCWCAKILPTREVKTLKDKEIKDLYNCLIKILKEAIIYRGASADAYVDIYGEKGDYLSKLKVYGREGKKCYRCGAKIKKITLAGRGTYFCPKCQK